MPNTLTIKILPTDGYAPSGKLADAELHFGPDAGPLAGLKLLGFAIWQRRSGPGHNVTMPSRTYSVAGERRNFALLRPAGAYNADGINAAILDAYQRHQDAQQANQDGAQDGAQASTRTAPARDFKAAAANDQQELAL